MKPNILDTNYPWLVLAPHLTYPTRNGADISIDRLARSISLWMPYVDLIAMDRVYRFKAGKLESERYYENKHRSKVIAAIRTIFFNDHYFKQKFNTPNFLAQSKTYLAERGYGAILFSYLSTASLVEYSLEKQPNRLHMVWTHNDEFRWFTDLNQQHKNPLVALNAKLSIKWLHKLLIAHQKDLLLLHVSDEDEKGFRQFYPIHSAIRVSIGADVQEHLPNSTASIELLRPLRLIFVGSLSMKMNVEALLNFALNYFPALSTGLTFPIEVKVVGSSPSPQVVALCNQMKWGLHKNVSDEKLTALFLDSDFSLMPFTYTNGAKLKLLNSLAHGVPFLGTKSVGNQLDITPLNCLIADNPKEWMDHIMAVRNRGEFIENDRASLVEFANQYSWDTVTKQLLDRVTNFSSKELSSIPPNL